MTNLNDCLIIKTAWNINKKTKKTKNTLTLSYYDYYYNTSLLKKQKQKLRAPQPQRSIATPRRGFFFCPTRVKVGTVEIQSVFEEVAEG